jgi:hypothetical protein
MAELVAAFGVPHTPFYPALVKREGPDCETGRLFAKVSADLAAAAPDLIVIVDTDHLNTFFLDNLPVFAVGVDTSFRGPNDEPPEIAVGTYPSAPDFAAHLRARGIAAGYDLALVQDFAVDHSIAVPLHFMVPGRDIPVVPLFVSAHVAPLPAARRCFDLGREVARAIADWPSHRRVVAIASGSFSLEVWGPRMAPGRPDGVCDPVWAERVCALIEEGRLAELVAEAGPEQLARAGNAGGELLDWIVVLGMIGARAPDYLLRQLQQGHAYACWRLAA